MACSGCKGSTRRSASPRRSARRARARSTTDKARSTPDLKEAVYLKYLPESAHVTIIGPITGNRYRVKGGEVAPFDPEDGEFLLTLSRRGANLFEKASPPQPDPRGDPAPVQEDEDEPSKEQAKSSEKKTKTSKEKGDDSQKG